MALMLVFVISIILPYPLERGPMGGAPHIGPRLGDGPIFEVSVSHMWPIIGGIENYKLN